MKKYLSLLIAVLFTLSLNAGGGKAKIVFDSTRYDFGYIQSLYQCRKSIHKIDYRRDCCT